MTSEWLNKQVEARALPVSSDTIDRIIVGESTPVRQLKRMIAAVAVSDAAVVVTGPTGSGKELVAEALHRASGRAGPLVAVNCAAIPADLLESELFGHEKGAFTGADRARTGRIEQAAGGTLFLDEIGDMPLALQAKLLRVLETRRIQRLGSNTETPIDFRLVTATHRDLGQAIEQGQFRADLVLGNPTSFTIVGDQTEDWSKNLDALDRHIAQLERICNAGSVSTSTISRARPSR